MHSSSNNFWWSRLFSASNCWRSCVLSLSNCWRSWVFFNSSWIFCSCKASLSFVRAELWFRSPGHVTHTDSMPLPTMLYLRFKTNKINYLNWNKWMKWCWNYRWDVVYRYCNQLIMTEKLKIYKILLRNLWLYFNLNFVVM